MARHRRKPDATTDRSGQRQLSPPRWPVVLLLAALTLAAYWPVLSAGFIYDDKLFVVDNPAIRGWGSLPGFFADPAGTTASVPWPGIWRPLRTASYALDYTLWGLRPLGFHLTGLLLHFCSGLLLAALAAFLLESELAGAVAAALFLLHPVQTEAVSWVASRGDLLMALFLLGSWLLRTVYLGTRNKRWLAAALVAFALSLLSKETAAVFPLALLAVDAIVPTAEGPRKRWREYLLWIGVVIAYLAARMAVLPALPQRPYWGGSLGTTLLTMCWALFEYLRLLVLPLWLHVDYVIAPVKSLVDWRWLAGLAAAAAVLILAFWKYRALRWPALAAAWLLIFLLPVSNLVPITAVMAERFLYVPLIGVCILAGWLLAKIPVKYRNAALVVVCVPMIALGIRRNLEWQEPFKFWRTELSRSPRSVIAGNNLGQICYHAGDLPQAESLYLQAMALDPEFPDLHASLGDLYYKTGRLQQALDQYAEYLRLKPDAHNRAQAEQRMERIRGLIDQQQNLKTL
ncbi:MAG TPA: tetratricopeptide repeat protein [Candidatus Edwardsbacteria bacterium]|nr:tetratricopeptide repeat protein [Candidatus Edwardsbacteria bacterium]